MPYFLIDGRSIYDWLRAPKFHLVTFYDGAAPQPVITDDLDGLADIHTMPLYPHVAEIFGTSESFSLLLRPDNYIGYIGALNTNETKEYLRKILS